VIHILDKIPLEKRNMVDEVTVDMAGSMNLIAKKCFPKTEIVTDRFHVQKLASEAVQEERIRLRWESIELENNAIQKARKEGAIYKAELLDNGDTQKQLLARSRYLLFKSKSKWTVRQIERAEILFKLYPTIEKAYDLAQGLSYIFENNTHKDTARLKLAHWYNKVEKSQFKSFNTISRSIQIHYIPILNYFNNRSTNASAESFNAKIKEFRAQFRGVRDVKFFLYRLTKLFA
jgi:transposase